MLIDMKAKYSVRLADGTIYEVALEPQALYRGMLNQIKQDAKERGFKAKVVDWEMIENANGELV